MRQSRVAAYDVVTANSLAAHLGMTNVAPLTAEAVIEQRSDGCYDQAGSPRSPTVKLQHASHMTMPIIAQGCGETLRSLTDIVAGLMIHPATSWPYLP